MTNIIDCHKVLASTAAFLSERVFLSDGVMREKRAEELVGFTHHVHFNMVQGH